MADNNNTNGGNMNNNNNHYDHPSRVPADDTAVVPVEDEPGFPRTSSMLASSTVHSSSANNPMHPQQQQHHVHNASASGDKGSSIGGGAPLFSPSEKEKSPAELPPPLAARSNSGRNRGGDVEMEPVLRGVDDVHDANSIAGDEPEEGEEGGKKNRAKVFSPGVLNKDEPYGIDCDYIFNMLERKNMETLNEKIGGLESLLRILCSDGDRGIDSSTVDIRRERYGANELVRKEPPALWEFYWDAFKDPLIIILCVCAVVSIIFGLTLENPHSGKVERETGWIEGTAIIISVAVVTSTQALTNWSKARKFAEMEKDQSVHDAQVFRDGHEITIPSNEIVVGDVLVIEGGMMLDVDGIYIHGSDLKTNESAMTGEPDLIKKNADKDPFFLSGTVVEEGEGRMLVVGVGMEGVQGRLKEATDEDAADTPLQQHLGELADLIAKIAFAAASLLIIALFIKEGVLISQGDRKAEASNFLKYIIIGVALVVVAVPEGLPLAVTIALAFGMKSMMDDNCLVRVLASCETMGAATAVCSDKTGTLTTNVMSCAQGVVGNEEFYIGGYGLRPRASADVDPTVLDRNDVAFNRLSEKVIDLFCDAIAFNSTAREQEIDGRVQWVGNKTEHGLLGFINLARRDYKRVRASVGEENVRQFPFNSKKKRMTTIVRRESGSLVFVKGASEVVLADCSRYMNENGSVMAMGEADAARFAAMIEDMAVQGNRTIAVAYTTYSPDAETTDGSFPEEEPDFTDYILLGVLGIQDPIREEVPEAVRQCKEAGVRVRMVTGDNINTAIAIAKKCGIFEENKWDLAMLGQDFRTMYQTDRDRLKEIVPRLCVLARSSPQDKYILVSMLQEIGDVVGVTGDGTNDAPALKLANVGFAMQIGTDIAKGAADMVLTDNNFASVVNAIRWGRAVNDAIRKFLQFQLSINVGGVILTFVASVASPTSKEPFSAVQLLWLNLIMDTLAAIALATESPSDSCLRRLPSFQQASIISRRMWSFVVLHGSMQTIIILLMLFLGHDLFETVEGDECDLKLYADNNETLALYNHCDQICKTEGGKYYGHYCQQGTEHSTIMFNTYIWFQIFNIFNARKLYGEHNIFEGFTRSKPFFIVLVIILAFQIFAVEAAGSFLNTTRLNWRDWLICVGVGAFSLPLGVLVRLLPIEEPIPEDIQKMWDEENKLRERLDVPLIHPSTKERGRFVVKSGDPSLQRRTSAAGLQRTMSLRRSTSMRSNK